MLHQNSTHFASMDSPSWFPKVRTIDASHIPYMQRFVQHAEPDYDHQHMVRSSFAPNSSCRSSMMAATKPALPGNQSAGGPVLLPLVADRTHSIVLHNPTSTEGTPTISTIPSPSVLSASTSAASSTPSSPSIATPSLGPLFMSYEELQARYDLQSILRDSIFGKVFAGVDRATGQAVAIKLSNLRRIREGRSINDRAVLENPIHESSVMRKLDEPLPASDTNLQAAQCICESCVSSHQPTVSPPIEGALPIHHPHVVSLLAEYCDNQVHWMVMPLQKGEFFDVVSKLTRPPRHPRPSSLSSTGFVRPAHQLFEGVSGEIGEGRRRSGFSTAFLDMDRKFRNYFRQMVSGLSFIHAHDVCHLDFSLENLLVDEAGNLKVCDFGVAREMPPSLPGTTASLPGCKFEKPGKLRYMSPEVLAGFPFEGRKADIFALGVTLFCMLTAHPPFEMASNTDPGFQLVACGKLWQLIRLLHVEDLVPESAVDLMQQMMWQEPYRRISLEAIKNHPYYLYQDEESDFKSKIHLMGSKPAELAS